MNIPHFNNGQILLKNTTDELWYYLGIVLNEEDILTLNPAQIAATIVDDTYYADYAVIIDSDGNYWKLTLVTIAESVINYSLVPLTIPARPDRVVLLDAVNNVYYRLLLVNGEDDSAPNPQLVALSAATNTIQNLPWRQIVGIDFKTETSVVIPVN